MSLTSVMNFFSGLPLDFVVIAGVLVLVFFATLRKSSRAVVLALAFLTAIPLQEAAAHSGIIKKIYTQTQYAELLLVVLVLLASYILIARILGNGVGAPQMVPRLVGAVAATVIVVVVWLEIPVLDSLWHFSDQMRAVFGESSRLWWILGSLVALAYARS
ncbi:MAG: hypothetical protein UY63_C0025G0002 [Parcubacteria group bacterium GW2011_GWA2_51_10]|nr:MAG: hypothetical protein UY63_C0025G0002 [Parcubacteria group bacterium GW2011_GWA2_51_10]